MFNGKSKLDPKLFVSSAFFDEFSSQTLEFSSYTTNCCDNQPWKPWKLLSEKKKNCISLPLSAAQSCDAGLMGEEIHRWSVIQSSANSHSLSHTHTHARRHVHTYTHTRAHTHTHTLSQVMTHPETKDRRWQKTLLSLNILQPYSTGTKKNTHTDLKCLRTGEFFEHTNIRGRKQPRQKHWGERHFHGNPIRMPMSFDLTVQR